MPERKGRAKAKARTRARIRARARAKPVARPEAVPAGTSISQGLINATVLVLLYLVSVFGLTAIAYIPYAMGIIDFNTLNFVADAIAGFSFAIATFIYLIFYKRLGGSGAIRSLGLKMPGNIISTVSIGLLLFLAIVALELIVGLIGQATNVQINTNVQTVLAGAPLWFFIFAAIIEPINEEIMFRGLMVPRIGIIPSALIFGFAHYTYYSTFGIEVIAASIFGLLAGYIYKKTGSIYPAIIAHILVNTIAVIGILSGI